jgi:hypothetical protein
MLDIRKDASWMTKDTQGHIRSENYIKFNFLFVCKQVMWISKIALTGSQIFFYNRIVKAQSNFIRRNVRLDVLETFLKITNPKHILELTAGSGTGSLLSLSVGSN